MYDEQQQHVVHVLQYFIYNHIAWFSLKIIKTIKKYDIFSAKKMQKWINNTSMSQIFYCVNVNTLLLNIISNPQIYNLNRSN